MNNPDLLFFSVAQIGTLYRSGQLSPVEVAGRCLAQIEALDPVLNAFITVTAEQALRQAALAEQELRAGHDRGPLHGVPIALKDLIDTAGILTTCASRILNDHVPQHDAVIVRHLNAAGAVSLGKTNCSEFAMGVPHPDYGQSNNPWDAARTSGASSGGSAAAVAAGLCFAAVGTDTGGSIRIPASYCGLAGLKPTYGLVDVEGVFPLSWSLDHVGPLARSSADAALLLGGMTGQHFQKEVHLKGKRFGVIQRSGPGVEPEVTAVFDAACDALRAAGAEVVNTEVPGLEQVDAALLGVLLPEAAAIHTHWIGSRADNRIYVRLIGGDVSRTAVILVIGGRFGRRRVKRIGRRNQRKGDRQFFAVNAADPIDRCHHLIESGSRRPEESRIFAGAGNRQPISAKLRTVAERRCLRIVRVRAEFAGFLF